MRRLPLVTALLVVTIAMTGAPTAPVAASPSPVEDQRCLSRRRLPGPRASCPPVSACSGRTTGSSCPADPPTRPSRCRSRTDTPM